SLAEGNVGAGAGASVGKLFGIGRAMKGGIGTASVEVGGITVAALVAVNAIGDVVDPRTGRVVAGARTADGKKLVGAMRALRRGELPARLEPSGAAGTATTLAVVATDAVLTKAEANKVAQMAHDGLARSINPVHTMGDGDVVFALATGASGRSATPTSARRPRRKKPETAHESVAHPSPRPPRRRRCRHRLLLRLRDPAGPHRHATDRLRARQRRYRRTLDRDDLALRIERLAARSPARDRPDLPARTRRRCEGTARPQLDRGVHEPSRRRSEEGARRDRRRQGRVGRPLARRLPDSQLHRQRRRVGRLACGPRRRPESRRVVEPGVSSRQRVQRRRAVSSQAELAAGSAGDEVTPGVAWMTIRSDNNDKYAQPDGVW